MCTSIQCLAERKRYNIMDICQYLCLLAHLQDIDRIFECLTPTKWRKKSKFVRSKSQQKKSTIRISVFRFSIAYKILMRCSISYKQIQQKQHT